MQTKQKINRKGFASCLSKVWLLLGFMVSLSALAKGQVIATVLYFDEIEVGIEAYTTRFVIADGLVRIDDGSAEDSYVLFDSRTGVLRSVTHSDQSVLEIPLLSDTKAPDLRKRFESLNTQIELVSDKSGPKIEGVQSNEFVLKVSGKNCARFSSVDGLLGDELKLLRAYEKALVANNMQNIGNQLPEYITDCMLVNELYAADWYLSKGFPVMYMESDGVQRFLKNYKQGERLDAELFETPKGYTVFSLDEKIGL